MQENILEGKWSQYWSRIRIYWSRRPEKRGDKVYMGEKGIKVQVEVDRGKEVDEKEGNAY